MNKQKAKAADTTAVGTNRKVKQAPVKSAVTKAKAPTATGKKMVGKQSTAAGKQPVVKQQGKEPLYTLTHREIDKSFKTVAYHLTTRKGARYRVEKPVMIDMVAAGAVKDVTIREVGGETQVVGIGMSVGLYPKVLNLTELPLRAANLKKAQDGILDQGPEEPVVTKVKRKPTTTRKPKDKSIILEVAVGEGTKGRKKQTAAKEAELVY